MIPVSNLDAAMLYAETPEMPMHTMGVLILEPDAAPETGGAMRLLPSRLRAASLPSGFT